jgi:hypothetical protein
VNDPPGWRRSADDDRDPDSGITLLVHSALGRACAVAHVPIPDSIRTAALDVQAGLRFRGYESADPDIRFNVPTRGGRYLSTQTRMIWYPWAVEGLVNWPRCAEKLHLPPETKRTLDRSLGQSPCQGRSRYAARRHPSGEAIICERKLITHSTTRLKLRADEVIE